MQVVTHDEAMALFDYGALVDFMDERHREPAALGVDSWLESDAGDGLLARTGFVPRGGLGVKLASVFPRNVDVPTVHSAYVLFDPDTGEERAVILGNALTWFKTACDSALGTRHLARSDSRTLVMVGAGSMAPHLVRAHRAVRPSIDRVLVWNRTPERAARVAAELGATATDDLAAAVASADVVSCATMTDDPLIHGEWVRSGTHVDLVGSFRPNMREADDDLLRSARIFVDSRATTLEKTGELAIPLATGAIEESDVRGDLYELASGTVEGRTGPDDVTVFKNGGGGHLDLMAAQFLLDRSGR